MVKLVIFLKKRIYTNIRVIDEKTVKEKMNIADPVLAAIVRGLSLRIGDANALAEKHWLELNVYKSLK